MQRCSYRKSKSLLDTHIMNIHTLSVIWNLKSLMSKLEISNILYRIHRDHITEKNQGQDELS
jgi:hypothetical protein